MHIFLSLFDRSLVTPPLISILSLSPSCSFTLPRWFSNSVAMPRHLCRWRQYWRRHSNTCKCPNDFNCCRKLIQTACQLTTTTAQLSTVGIADTVETKHKINNTTNVWTTQAAPSAARQIAMPAPCCTCGCLSPVAGRELSLSCPANSAGDRHGEASVRLQFHFACGCFWTIFEISCGSFDSDSVGLGSG